MEAVGERLRYARNDVADVEKDVSFVVKQTITQGCNDGGTINFRFPADPERFTDLNSTMMRLTVGVALPNGTWADFQGPNHQAVWLDPVGMHSLFSSVEVLFNDVAVTTMSMYPFTTALARGFGMNEEQRLRIWDSLDGSHSCTLLKADCAGGDIGVEELAWNGQIDRDKTLYGRIYADILTSSRQYLPPCVTLGISLRRAPDRFSLVTTHANHDYRLKITAASVYIKRLQLRPSFVPRALESVRGGQYITFNRLECRMMAIARGSSVFRWLDCLNGAPLPNRIYIGFVAQAGIYGVITTNSTYFDCLNLRAINFKLNGRDLLVEPIRTTYVKDPATHDLQDDESDAREGYLSMIEIMNQVSDETGTVRMSYTDYLRGANVFGVELGKCGEKSGGVGTLDIEATFNDATTDIPACILLFTEKTATAQIAPGAPGGI